MNGVPKPSPRWKEKVVEMGSLAASAVGSLIPVPGVSRAVSQMLRSTNITFEDDLKGSKAVWTEVGSILAKDGLIKTDAWPWAAVENEIAKPILPSTVPAAVPTYLKGF